MRARTWLRSRRGAGPRSAVVLMYHGIGEVDIDPWGPYVSPSHFDEHLEVIRDRARPLGLADLVDRCTAGELSVPATALTIDDGYANVLHGAVPILERHEVPASVFVISGPLLTAGEYWWDELAALLLIPGSLPATLASAHVGDGEVIELGRASSYTATEWRADHGYRDGAGRPGPRMALYHMLWERLVALGQDERRRAIDELRAWAGRPAEVRDSHRSLTTEELLELDGGVIEIGGHTVTHPLLPEVTTETQRQEVGQGKRDLERLLGRSIRTFSYPFGAHDEASVAAVRSSGYEVAVTTRAQAVSYGADPLRIGRFDVKNWDGDRFAKNLDRWLRAR